MKQIYRIFCMAGFLILGVLCTRGSTAGLSSKQEQVSLRYAKGFRVEYHEDYTCVTVLNPWNNTQTTFQYVLAPRGTPRPEGYQESQYIEIPLRSIVTMSTTYLGLLKDLEALDTLVGHNNFQRVNTPEVRQMIDEGGIKEIGSGTSVNLELLMDLSPDVILTYGIGNSYDSHPKLLEAGLTTVISAAYMEATPLGRAEWIKFIALFYNKEAEAERLFKMREQEYHRLRTQAAQTADRPTVLLNAPFNGDWWIPGGKSYIAAFLKDAGARYLWANDDSSGSRVVDIEAVYERAAEADFWLNPGQWSTLEDGTRADERLMEFRAFREGNVYNNNARVNEYGGNDYWESGMTRPDVVLSDLIKIFHPKLLPEHELLYYRKLE